MTDQEKRDNEVENLIPKNWDTGPYDWAIMIRNMLATIPGVKVTGSGTSNGEADCSFECEGKGFWVRVKRTGQQESTP